DRAKVSQGKRRDERLERHRGNDSGHGTVLRGGKNPMSISAAKVRTPPMRLCAAPGPAKPARNIAVRLRDSERDSPTRDRILDLNQTTPAAPIANFCSGGERRERSRELAMMIKKVAVATTAVLIAASPLAYAAETSPSTVGMTHPSAADLN